MRASRRRMRAVAVRFARPRSSRNEQGRRREALESCTRTQSQTSLAEDGETQAAIAATHDGAMSVRSASLHHALREFTSCFEQSHRAASGTLPAIGCTSWNRFRTTQSRWNGSSAASKPKRVFAPGIGAADPGTAA